MPQSFELPDIDFFIRPVLPQQAKALRDLAYETFAEAFEHKNTPEDFALYAKDAFSLAAIQDQLANPDSNFLFLEKQGVLAGYLKLNTGAAQTDDKLENALEIERIYLKSGFQGQGGGQVLFKYVMDLAHAGAFDWVWLGVWDQNKDAIRFYERRGFEAFATHGFLLGTDPQTDILMRCPLTS